MQTGKTGMAPFINDTCSIRDSSNLGRLSSGGSVGAILCFLLFILVRLLSAGSFLLQQKSLEQQPLQRKYSLLRPTYKIKSFFAVLFLRFAEYAFATIIRPRIAFLLGFSTGKTATTFSNFFLCVTSAFNFIRFATAEKLIQTQ